MSSSTRASGRTWAASRTYAVSSSRRRYWLPPDNMIMRVIDPSTGLLATEWCPARARDWYKPTDAPNEVCQEHFAPVYDEPVWSADGDYENRRDQPWTEDVRREVGRALRRILRF